MKRIGLFALVIMAWASSAQAAIKLEHIVGTTELSSTPKRVVAIGIGTIDTLDALGIKPVAVSKSTAIPDYLSKYMGKNIPSAGTIFEPDFEAIYSQKPDVIIVGSRSAKHFDELKKIAPTYVHAIPNGSEYWPETQKLWRDLGVMFGKEKQVEKVIDSYSQRFAQIKAYNQKNQIDALMLMSSGGNTTSFGMGSRFAVLFQDFGFKPTMNIVNKKDDNTKKGGKKTGGHGNLVSYELISQENPSTLLILDRDKLVNKGKSTTRQDFENALVKSTNAYKNDRMIYLDIPAWYTATSGMKATDTMLKDIEGLMP